MSSDKMRHFTFALLLSLLPPSARAAETDRVDFVRDIQPLFDAKCNTCHGPLRKKGGLRLDAGVLALKGGKDGAVIKPGDVDGSDLLERVLSREEDEKMPPEGKPLGEREVALLKRWIAQGAAVPPDEEIPAGPDQHWFFQKPMKAEPPENATLTHPIDRFLAAEWAKRGLAPQAAADQATLLRRVTLDLIGVPPSEEEMVAFENDAAPEAYERVVDRLLANEQHGVRWGRHFMDVWRYSDEVADSCNAKETMLGEFHLWRWRDWIVNALNADKPYDRMIQEMLAGDELAPADPQVLAATGFIVRNYTTLGSRDLWLSDTVEHTAQAFLGVTMKCARCHDHKYDPIPQADYYRLRAVFEPIQKRIDLIPGTTDPLKAGIPRIYDGDLAVKTRLFKDGNPQQPDAKTPIEPAAPSLLRLAGFSPKDVALPREASRPGTRTFVRGDRLAAVEAGLKTARTEQEKLPAKAEPTPLEQAALNAANARIARGEAELAAVRACIAADDALAENDASDAAKKLSATATQARRTFARTELELTLAEARHERAKAREKKVEGQIAAGEEKVKKAKEAMAKLEAEHAKPAGQYESLWPRYNDHSTGRRLALAQWMTQRDNPATARVLVNHVWLRHFGAPLVASVFDFGMHGAKPQNPALLDWLAVDFMEHGWSLRHLHRLIVTSQAYRLSSARQPGGENEKRDPENRWHWRMNSQRMQAEQVRDSILAISGRLDPALGGPPLDPKQADRAFRRSIFFRHTPGLADPMMNVFDGADPNECYRRQESIVPQQALALANSRLLFEQSRAIAQRIAAPANEAFVESAYRRVLGRPPGDRERGASLRFLENTAPFTDVLLAVEKEPLVSPSADVATRRREQLVQVLLNHTDFVTIR